MKEDEQYRNERRRAVHAHTRWTDITCRGTYCGCESLGSDSDSMLLSLSRRVVQLAGVCGGASKSISLACDIVTCWSRSCCAEEEDD